MSEHNIKKKEIFAVPDGYFEQLNKDILDATAKSHTTAPHRKKHLLGGFGRVFGYAAAIAALLIVAGNLLFTGNEPKNKAIADNINAESEYIDNIFNSYTIDDYTFYCYLTESEYE